MSDVKRLIGEIIESYDAHDTTVRFDSDYVLNQEILIKILEETRKVLLPGFFDGNTVRRDYREYVLGDRLEFIEYNLKKQVAKVLGGERACDADCVQARAKYVVGEFLNKLPEIRERLYEDVQAAFDGDPAAYSTDEIIFSYPGFYAITVYRIAHELSVLNVPLIPRIMSEHAHGKTGIDIHPAAAIGRSFFIDHGTGIVIGSTTSIGDNVKIYQGVTLGALSTRHGQELRGVKRHPTIGNNVTIYSNATILGGDTVIGDGVTVGGNAFIVRSVAENEKVTAEGDER